MATNVIILAAGRGTRMKSSLLKVAHHVAGKPIVSYVVDAVDRLGIDQIYLVVGHQSEALKSIIDHPNVTYVAQEQQLGTGHAVMQVSPHVSVKSDDTILVLAGDCPLLKTETLSNLLETHQESNAAATILTVNMPDPATYGRILRGKMGTVMGIKEAKDCTEEELEITEINTGAYAFNQSLLFDSLSQVGTDNKQGEYYLTDVVHILKQQGKVVSAYCMDNPDQAIGINTRMDLAKTNQTLYYENNYCFMEKGVTIIDPRSTFIDSTVDIGQDTIIEPFTIIRGDTRIGSYCKIGAYSFIDNGQIDSNTTLMPYTIVRQPEVSVN